MGALLADTADVDLARTLRSGQTFRWRWVDGRATGTPADPARGSDYARGADPACGADGGRIAVGIVGRCVVRLMQDAGGIRFISPDAAGTRDAVRRYLGVLPRSAHPRRAETALAGDPVLARILPRTAGISLLAQDPWEILISFIVSQNNNIPKIARSIERLARRLGEPLGDGMFAFPAPDRLAAAPMRTLAACSLGYRAPYVRAAARLVAGGRLDLHALARAEEEMARETLLRVHGIGDKVCDCVLLFGLGHRSVFPVDIWVRRAVERLYFRGRPRHPREIRAFARDRFGPLAGYAQQHLFAYEMWRSRSRTAGSWFASRGPLSRDLTATVGDR